jgi:hypothetical protein
MIEYNKIETIYERDMNGSKRLIEGQFRNETVKYLANNCWEFTEKIDGTNIRVCWDGHKITFGGRTERAQIPTHLFAKLQEIFLTNEVEELFEQKFGEKVVILFGEGYGAKIQSGGLYRSDVGFILFDVMIGDNYQPRTTVEGIAKCFGLEIVPVVLVGTIKEAVEYIKAHPRSTIGKAPMEGVVGRPMIEMRDRSGKRVIVKIKACDFEGGAE